MSEKETPTATEPKAESSAAASSLPPPPQFEPAKLEAVKAYRSVGGFVATCGKRWTLTLLR